MKHKHSHFQISPTMWETEDNGKSILSTFSIQYFLNHSILDTSPPRTYRTSGIHLNYIFPQINHFSIATIGATTVPRDSAAV